MSNTRSLRVDATFETLERPLVPVWPVRVTLSFGEGFVLRSTPLGARVGHQYLEGVAKAPRRAEITGFLRSGPRPGDELVLRDGSNELRTGIRYRGGPAASASLGDDELYAPPEAEARAQLFDDESGEAASMGYALEACVVRGASIACGTCTATERRVRGAPGHLINVPASHVYGNAAHHQLTDAACAAFVRMREAAIAAGVFASTDDYLKVVSGHRDYQTQTGLWKERLRAVFTSFGCTNWATLARAVDAANAALASGTPPLAAGAWLDRFRTEVGSAGQPAGCDPTRMRSAAAAEHQTVPATGTIDPVELAVRIGRQTVAPPGSSPHHTGRAVDLYLGSRAGSGAASSGAANVAWQRGRPWFQWLVCNASRFGFYPYIREPWHWEYNPADMA